MSFYQRITSYLPLPIWHIVGLLGLVLGLAWIIVAYRGEGQKVISAEFPSVKSSEQNQQPIELLAMSPAAEKKWMETVAQSEPTQIIDLPASPAIMPSVKDGVPEVPEVPKEQVPPLMASLPEIKKQEEKIKPVPELVDVVKNKKEDKKKELPIKQEIKSPAKVVSEVPKKAQERYTVQLLNSQNQSAIQMLLDKNSRVKQLRMMTIQQQGQERYLLLYGNFSSREEASSAIAHIPAQVVQGSPWIRSLGATHETK